MTVSGPSFNINVINKLNERELSLNTSEAASWHRKYKNSAYVFIGGLNYKLTEGDIAIVFSQWGEPVDINLLRDKKTGKSRGFAFLAYEDQRSTNLAVDNANGTELIGRRIRVDHVDEYRAKQEYDENDLDEDGNPKVIEYKATGAEGGGIGAFGVTKSEQKLQEVRDGNKVREPVAKIEDDDVTWEASFRKQMRKEEKRAKRKKKHRKEEGSTQKKSVKRIDS